MGKVALKKVRFTGLKKNYKLLMEQLHRSWSVQVIKNDTLIDSSETEGDKHFGVYDLARVSFAIDFLSPYRTEKSKLDSFLSAGKLVLSEVDAKGRLALFEKDSERVLKRCETLEEDMVRNQNVIDKMKDLADIVLPYANLDVVVGDDFHSDNVEVHIYQGPSKNLKALVRSISAVSNLVDIETLQSNKVESVVRIVSVKDVLPSLQNVIDEHDFSSFDWGQDLSEYKGSTPAHILESVRGQIVEREQKQISFTSEAEELAHFLDDLKILHDFNEWRTHKNDIQSDMYTSDRVFVFDGWMPTGDFDALEKWINLTFVGEVSMDELEIAEDEEVPIQFKNNFFSSPFEIFTNMYGAPSNKDLDPTPVLSIFFFIFFGLCFSDVGYGVLLFLASSFFLLFGKFVSEARKGLWLLFFCGITTIIGGVITGSYLGLTPNQLPSFMVTDAFVPGTETPMLLGQLFSPVDQPIVFLEIALLLGALHLLIGISIDGIKAWKDSNKTKTLFESAPWVLVLAACAPLSLTFLDADFLTSQQSSILGNAALVGVIWLFAGHMILEVLAKKAWWKVLLVGPLSGALKLFGIMNYLTDLLSYSRIMALGLATGVIAYAMNLSGVALAETIPVVGGVVLVLFVLFGHALNFGLSLLAAFIHTGRLHFVEFFSKFYDGSGQRFAPFKRASRYLFFRS